MSEKKTAEKPRTSGTGYRHRVPGTAYYFLTCFLDDVVFFFETVCLTDFDDLDFADDDFDLAFRDASAQLTRARDLLLRTAFPRRDFAATHRTG